MMMTSRFILGRTGQKAYTGLILMRLCLILALLPWARPAAAQQTIVLSATHLDFHIADPAQQSETQTLTLTSAGGGEIDFQVNLTSDAYWLSVQQSGSRTPATISVFVRRTNDLLAASVIMIVPSRGSGLVIPVTEETGLPAGILYTSTISPGSIAFTTTQGANPHFVNLTSTTPPPVPAAILANAVSDQNWLRLPGGFVGSSYPSSSLAVSCQCADLPAGNYSGVINATGYTYEPYRTIPVTLTVNPPPTGGISALASSLSFDFQAGGSLPAAQSVSVASTTSASAAFRASASSQTGSWLSVNPASANTPASLSVSANPSGLAPGSYAGTVTLTPSVGAVVSIPVTLTVRAVAPIAASAASLAFSCRVGDAAPADQAVQLTGGGASPSFKIEVTGSASWLKAAPASGTAPASIAVGITSCNLPAGSYQAALTISGTGSAPGTVTLPVTLQIAAPLPTILKMAHAASYAEGAVAPGEIVTLFGTNIGPDALVGLALDESGKVAAALGGAQVLFDGTPAPLIYVSKSQIAAVAPYELAGRQTTTVQVAWSGQRSNGVTVPVKATAPGIFTADSSGAGPAAILNADGSYNSARNPAAAGDTVVLYLTGEGQTAPKGITGKVTAVSDVPPLTPAPVLAVGVLIDSQPAQVIFAGEAPGFVSGILQVNVQIPAASKAGALPIIVSVGGTASQAGVTVSVK
jgi:uncharacterized protein (TIGR03437 family)